MRRAHTLRTSVSVSKVNQFPAPPPEPHVTAGGGGGTVGGTALSHGSVAACAHRSARAVSLPVLRRAHDRLVREFVSIPPIPAPWGAAAPLPRFL